MAEREGFEPSVLVKAHTLSRRDPSATRASLHNKAIKPARLLGRKKLQVVTLVFVRIKIGKRFKNPARSLLRYARNDRAGTFSTPPLR